MDGIHRYRRHGASEGEKAKGEARLNFSNVFDSDQLSLGDDDTSGNEDLEHSHGKIIVFAYLFTNNDAYHLIPPYHCLLAVNPKCNEEPAIDSDPLSLLKDQSPRKSALKIAGVSSSDTNPSSPKEAATPTKVPDVSVDYSSTVAKQRSNATKRVMFAASTTVLRGRNKAIKSSTGSEGVTLRNDDIDEDEDEPTGGIKTSHTSPTRGSPRIREPVLLVKKRRTKRTAGSPSHHQSDSAFDTLSWMLLPVTALGAVINISGPGTPGNEGEQE
jgi:sulfur relay (sulfurtransferase) DsrC/TusE family protein